MIEEVIQTQRDDKETSRVEAFSDGVFAIAITLLVLDIKVPSELPEGAGLGDALLQQWPVYLAFFNSFATIGVMWLNHHRLFTLIKRVDHTLLVLNTLLLGAISLVPFSSALLSEYLTEHDGPVAAVVYSGMFVLMAILFNLLWRHASTNNRLLDRNFDPTLAASISKSFRFGPLYYLLTLLLSPLSPLLTLLLNIVLAIYYALPPKTSRG